MEERYITPFEKGNVFKAIIQLANSTVVTDITRIPGANRKIFEFRQGLELN